MRIASRHGALGACFATGLLLGIDPMGNAASAQGLVQADANGNHSPEIQLTPNRGVGGERWRNDLVPAVIAAIGPGATVAELATLAAPYPPPAGGNAGWVIANGAALAGNLTVVHYDAFEDSNPAPESPADGNVWMDCILTAAGNKDCVTIRYNNLVGGVEVNPVAPNVLRWVQFVCTNSPAGGGGVCPPAAAAYLDPRPNDDTLPFYYTEAEHALFSGAGNVPPLTFYDKSLRGFPVNRVAVNWTGRLYLVEWNGVTPNPAAPGPNGILTIRGGVEWGWRLECIAIRQPVSTYLRGGGDRDKPTTEYVGIDPSGVPPPACTESVPAASTRGVWLLALVLLGAPIFLMNRRRSARSTVTPRT
jgi:hypothetical protein